MSIRTKQALVTTLKIFNAVGMALLIALVFVVLAKIAASQKQATSDTTASTRRVENDLNCLGRFFNQKNRQNLVITDLNSCTIQNTSDGNETHLTGPPNGTFSSHPSTTVKKTTPAASHTSTSAAIPSVPTTAPVAPQPTNNDGQTDSPSAKTCVDLAGLTKVCL